MKDVGDTSAMIERAVLGVVSGVYSNDLDHVARRRFVVSFGRDFSRAGRVFVLFPEHVLLALMTRVHLPVLHMFRTVMRCPATGMQKGSRHSRQGHAACQDIAYPVYFQLEGCPEFRQFEGPLQPDAVRSSSAALAAIQSARLAWR